MSTPKRRGRKPVARDQKKISRNLYMTDATMEALNRLSADSGVTASELVTALIWAEEKRRFEMQEYTMENKAEQYLSYDKERLKEKIKIYAECIASHSCKEEIRDYYKEEIAAMNAAIKIKNQRDKCKQLARQSGGVLPPKRSV